MVNFNALCKFILILHFMSATCLTSLPLAKTTKKTPKKVSSVPGEIEIQGWT